MSSSPSPALPTHCRFEHRALAALDTPVFRRTEGDGVAALALRLDGAEAVVPLPSVAKLFGISPESPDGVTLRLVGEGLRFVSCLRLGDPLPAEVLNGDASWQPAAYHRQVASARTQMQLVQWLGGTEEGQPVTAQMVVVAINDPAIRPRIQEAMRRAAAELALAGDAQAVAGLVEQLADELSYIEALRDRLLGRVQALAARVARLGRLANDPGALASGRRETVFQVNRLLAVGLAQITRRFTEIDAQTGEILPSLRNLDRQRSFLRPNRDWLYCTQIAWQPLLDEWDAAPDTPGSERVWKLMDRLYRFLAPRHMAVQEWQAASFSSGGDRAKAVVW